MAPAKRSIRRFGGAVSGFLPWLLHNRDVILMLHRVLPDDAEAALPHRRALCIGAPTFVRMLEWLTGRVAGVDLDTRLNRPRERRPRVALSFDDGWADNATIAMPALVSAGVPASIFLSTAMIGSVERRFWWESIGETLWRARRDEIDALRAALADEALPSIPDAALGSSADDRRSRAILAWMESLKCQTPDALNRVADTIDRDALPHAMCWEQVVRMERTGLVRFGSHGHTHSILTRLSDERVRAELVLSRQALDAHCEKPSRIFCYPNGDHDTRVRRLVAEHGYSHALGTRRGYLRRGLSPYELPRIGVGQNHAAEVPLLMWHLAYASR